MRLFITSSHTHARIQAVEKKCSKLNASTLLLVPYSIWNSANQSEFVFGRCYSLLTMSVHWPTYTTNVVFSDAHMHQIGIYHTDGTMPLIYWFYTFVVDTYSRDYFQVTFFRVCWVAQFRRQNILSIQFEWNLVFLALWMPLTLCLDIKQHTCNEIERKKYIY